MKKMHLEVLGNIKKEMDERLKRKLKAKKHPADPKSADLSDGKSASEHHGVANADETHQNPAVFKSKSEEMAEINNKPSSADQGDAPELHPTKHQAGEKPSPDGVSDEDLDMLRAHHMKKMRG